MVEADAENRFVAAAQLDIGDGLRIRAGRDRMLAVGDEPVARDADGAQRVKERVDRAVAAA